MIRQLTFQMFYFVVQHGFLPRQSAPTTQHSTLHRMFGSAHHVHPQVPSRTRITIHNITTALSSMHAQHCKDLQHLNSGLSNAGWQKRNLPLIGYK
jgi:hypothetical protein